MYITEFPDFSQMRNFNTSWIILAILAQGCFAISILIESGAVMVISALLILAGLGLVLLSGKKFFLLFEFLFQTMGF